MGTTARKFDTQADMFRQAQTWADLSRNEREVLLFIERAAREDRELEKSEDIAFAMKFEGGTQTIRGIMLRLERKGYIKCKSYQRGRSVYVASIDKWTKPPTSVTLHWRHVYDQSKTATPTIPQQTVPPTIMAAIHKMMQGDNISFTDAQIRLMSHGVCAVETGT